MNKEIDNKKIPCLKQKEEKPRLIYQPPQLVALDSTEIEGGGTNVIENNSGVLMDS